MPNFVQSMWIWLSRSFVVIFQYKNVTIWYARVVCLVYFVLPGHMWNALAAVRFLVFIFLLLMSFYKKWKWGGNLYFLFGEWRYRCAAFAEKINNWRDYTPQRTAASHFCVTNMSSLFSKSPSCVFPSLLYFSVHLLIQWEISVWAGSGISLKKKKKTQPHPPRAPMPCLGPSCLTNGLQVSREKGEKGACK